MVDEELCLELADKLAQDTKKPYHSCIRVAAEIIQEDEVTQKLRDSNDVQ